MPAMKSVTRILLVLMATFAVALAACGDDDDTGDGASPSATESASASPSDGTSASPSATGGGAATATPASGGSPAPDAPVPVLDANTKKIGEGTISFVLVPGQSSPIDPIGLPLPAGATPPPCAAFVFSFGWQVTKPNPPGDAKVTFKIDRQGVVEQVASGASGTASVGCGLLTAVNEGDGEMSVSMHYFQGEIQP